MHRNESAKIGIGDAYRMAKPVDGKFAIIDQPANGSGRQAQNFCNLLDGVESELVRARPARGLRSAE